MKTPKVQPVYVRQPPDFSVASTHLSRRNTTSTTATTIPARL